MTLILGHRGARALWPENSLTGFRKAIELGVDIIEFDIHLSADGMPVVHHDPVLGRTSQGHGPVSALRAGELSRIALRGGNGDCIPTLDQVLDLVLGHASTSAVQLAVELKTSLDATPYPGIAEKVLAALERHGAIDRAMIASFLPDTLERVRRLNTEVGAMACVWRPHCELLGGLPAAIDRWMAIDGCILAVKEEFLSDNAGICQARVPPERLAVGLTNDPDRIDHWLGQPVRHLSTDHPDRALQLRARHSG